jgi:hypothetical protein
MAVPSITVIYPNSGSSGGARLLQIMGGGFQLSPDPPLTGPAPVANPSVRVTFGSGVNTAEGTRIAVVSSARLFVVVPASPNTSPGAVDVTIENIDQAGDVIPGETVTVVGGYTYSRPDLNLLPESDLTRITRTLIRELKKQVLQETSLSTGTDWASDPTAGVAAIAKVPAIVLHGPDLKENRFYSQNEMRELANTFGLGEKVFDGLRPAMTVDLTFNILGVTNSTIQNINLMSEVVSFFQRNKWLHMSFDSSNANSETARYEMDWADASFPDSIGNPNDSNIRAFRGAITIRGFDVDERSMVIGVLRELEDQTTSGSVLEPSAVLLSEPEQIG